jgi:hypothetical protein
MFVVSVVCCQVEISASCLLLVLMSPIECGVSECDREASIMRRPWPTGGLLRRKNISHVTRKLRSEKLSCRTPKLEF